MPGAISVHDEHAAWIFARTGQHRRSQGHRPKACRLKVRHGEVQCQLERRFIDVHLAPVPVTGIRPAVQEVCIERRQGAGIRAIEDHRPQTGYPARPSRRARAVEAVAGDVAGAVGPGRCRECRAPAPGSRVWKSARRGVTSRPGRIRRSSASARGAPPPTLTAAMPEGGADNCKLVQLPGKPLEEWSHMTGHAGLGKSRKC